MLTYSRVSTALEKVHVKLIARTDNVMILTMTDTSGNVLYTGRYEIGEANRNDSGSRNDIYNSFNYVVGIQLDRGYTAVDNFKVSVVEDNVLAPMTTTSTIVTLGNAEFNSFGATVSNGTATGAEAALLSTDACRDTYTKTGNYRISFDLTPSKTSRFYFGMANRSNGYAFEVNQTLDSLFLYKVENGKCIILAEEKDYIPTTATPVTLDVHDGIVSIYFDNFGQGADAFPKFEFYLPDANGKFGFWLEDGKVSNFNVGESTVTLPEETYLNPVNTGADPDVLFYEGTYYLYVYSGVSSKDIFRVYTSPDLVHFTARNVVFEWKDEYDKSAVRNSSWSPNVSYNEQDGLFYLFFASKRQGEDEADNIRSVFYATATSPYGPFEYRENGEIAPLKAVNPFEQPSLDPLTGNRTGAYQKSNEIDGHPFYDDDGKIYMSFSRYDWGGTIWIEEVTMKNGVVTPVEKNGEIVQERAIVPTLEWESDGATNLCEGGFIFKYEDLYYMIYATTSYARHYGQTYAWATSPLGPWTKSENGKFLTHNFTLDGPGDALIVPSPDGEELYLVYHRHFSTEKVHQRQTCVDKLVFVDDPTNPNGPKIITTAGPSSTPQKLPSNIYRYDVDRTNGVTLGDALLVLKNRNSTVEEYCGKYDANADGKVSLLDAVAVLANAAK